ncbi:sensor domain-containing diguanylate cyclase [Desulfofustis glycolicus]|uniref:diguanylate cyclase n=1 Tax=Desulfofustis glycolicus DSM 9705 TaxID=1121409 RepID=A0A1M5UGM4_9BACT|nr:diguanylate cyclase [Desulfofustis glycolicus]MCB2217506.1 diguanylate cyclase [Desulfobulbaceae bacterium]SHH62091.1 diguanylate cyclase (GGDEF) domain-containing protein [Desulfofustis glycolicus DSM 9705]
MVTRDACSPSLGNTTLPEPSAAAEAFVKLTGQKGVTLSDLTTILADDPPLANNFLRFAGAIVPASVTPIGSIRRALMTIGIKDALSLVPALSIMTRRDDHGLPPAFWDRPLARAFAARTLALLRTDLDPAAFFACALLYGGDRFKAATPTDATVTEQRADTTTPALHQHTDLLRFADTIAESLQLQQSAPSLADIVIAGRQVRLNRPECIDLYDETLRQWRRWQRAARLPVPDTLSGSTDAVNGAVPPTDRRTEAIDTIKILIADDDPLTLFILRRLLEQSGKTILTAEHGEQALALTLQHQPQMVITDWRMPELSGIELCKILRDTDSTRHIYIIMLTGRESEEELLEAFAAGADDYIVKPFKPKVLHARIRGGERLIRSHQTIIADRETIRSYVDRLAAANHTLQDLAMTDVLTGLPNRRSALSRLKEVVAEARRHHSPLSCIMLDIDHFKKINDRWGHDIGDRVLKQIADVLSSSARGYDLVSRIGGEEFLVICAHSNLDESRQLAERLRQAAANTVISHNEETIAITISCGVATWDETMVDGEDMTTAADQALYQAKRRGRNRVAVADGRQLGT